jgi:hypothetical protein
MPTAAEAPRPAEPEVGQSDLFRADIRRTPDGVITVKIVSPSLHRILKGMSVNRMRSVEWTDGAILRQDGSEILHSNSRMFDVDFSRLRSVFGGLAYTDHATLLRNRQGGQPSANNIEVNLVPLAHVELDNGIVIRPVQPYTDSMLTAYGTVLQRGVEEILKLARPVTISVVIKRPRVVGQ